MRTEPFFRGSLSNVVFFLCPRSGTECKDLEQPIPVYGFLVQRLCQMAQLLTLANSMGDGRSHGIPPAALSCSTGSAVRSASAAFGPDLFSTDAPPQTQISYLPS